MACEALGNIKSFKAIKPLIRALKDEDHKVRKCAAEALGDIGSDGAVVSLIETLEDE